MGDGSEHVPGRGDGAAPWAALKSLVYGPGVQGAAGTPRFKPHFQLQDVEEISEIAPSFAQDLTPGTAAHRDLYCV